MRRRECGAAAAQIRRAGGANVVVTSYEFLINKRDAPRMAALRWHYVILDEGHRVKNADCALARALRGYRVRHKLLLSGTPVQNALNELWALLNFLLPDMFGSAEEFDAWFGSRLAAGGVDVDGGCGGASEVLRQEQVLIVTNRLHQVLRPFLLRRTKAILAAALPPKIERAVACPASAYQAAMLALLRAKGAAVAHGGGGGGVQGVNNVIMEMRKVRGPRALQFSRPGVCSERGVTRARAWLQVCNDPVTSRLHVPGADEALADHCTPASVQLGGKMAALTTILRRLVPAGAPPSPPALRARAHLCKPLESVLSARIGRACVLARGEDESKRCRAQAAALLDDDDAARQRGRGAGVAGRSLRAPRRQHARLRPRRRPRRLFLLPQRAHSTLLALAHSALHHEFVACIDSRVHAGCRRYGRSREGARVDRWR